MIPQDFITEWGKSAPWSTREQVEQDLIICRALIEIFKHPMIAGNLAFRGGTALFKLHVAPLRYSEDIDLVQIHPGPIGPILDSLQEKLNPWLGSPKRSRSEGRVTCVYRMESEDGMPLKLKVEINSREHFSVLGFEEHNLTVESRWFSGTATILTYGLDELLGTKVRALYQRKKGRDLFDLWTAFQRTNARADRVVQCFLEYMNREGHRVSRKEFEQNLSRKLDDPGFAADIGPLVVSGTVFEVHIAGEWMFRHLLPLLPGRYRKGESKDPS